MGMAQDHRQRPAVQCRPGDLPWLDLDSGQRAAEELSIDDELVPNIEKQHAHHLLVGTTEPQRQIVGYDGGMIEDLVIDQLGSPRRAASSQAARRIAARTLPMP